MFTMGQFDRWFLSTATSGISLFDKDHKGNLSAVGGRAKEPPQSSLDYKEMHALRNIIDRLWHQ